MPAGRPLEFDPDTALEAATQLFWRQGYEATSLQDLLDEMQLSKSSFYQAFGSKHALFGRCIDHYRDSLARGMQQQLEAAPRAWDFIAGMLTSVARETRGGDARRGCLVMNTASEFGQSDPEVAARVKAGTARFRKVFLQAVKRAQAEGDIPADRDPALLADYLVTNMSGLRTLTKAGASAAAIRRIAGVTLSALR